MWGWGDIEHDNVILEAADYLKHNGVKTLGEDAARRANYEIKSIEEMASVLKDEAIEKIDSMTIGDWSEATGYMVAFIATILWI